MFSGQLPTRVFCARQGWCKPGHDLPEVHMRTRPRWAGATLALWVSFQVAACDDPSLTGPPDDPTPPPPVEAPDTAVAITGIGELVPGADVSLQGRNLDRVQSLTVDNVEVPFRASSAQAGSFTMPEMVACDVDGRPVEILVNGAMRLDAALRILDVVRLEVGESRRLNADDLRCLQISGAAENYLLTVNSLTTDRVTETPVVVRNAAPGSATVGGFAASAAASLSSPLQEGDLCVHADEAGHEAMAVALAGMVSVAAAGTWNPEPFDDYAGAVVGDTLEFVHWGGGVGVWAENREDVPIIRAEVVAVNAGQLLAVDLTAAEYPLMVTQEALARYQAAADLADAYTTRAVRAVINPEFVMPGGAGGRMVTVFEAGMTGSAIGAVHGNEIRHGERWGSDMFRARLAPRIHAFHPGQIASVIIHEAAHLADFLPASRDGGLPGSTGFYLESVAVSVEDMAARMHAGHETQASINAAMSPSGSRITRSPGSGVSLNSPWGPEGSAYNTWGLGAYDRGARILRHVQEAVGESGFERSGPTLHQRLVANADHTSLATRIASFDIHALAREAGMSAEDLMERSMLADVTDDLVEPDAVARFNLPQTTVWDNSPGASAIPAVANGRLMPRDRVLTREAVVPSGTYVYWYIPAKSGLGYSLEATEVELQPHHRVLLTRLR
jgi:hypothetical protein